MLGREAEEKLLLIPVLTVDSNETEGICDIPVFLFAPPRLFPT